MIFKSLTLNFYLHYHGNQLLDSSLSLFVAHLGFFGEYYLNKGSFSICYHSQKVKKNVLGISSTLLRFSVYSLSLYHILQIEKNFWIDVYFLIDDISVGPGVFKDVL